MSPSSYGSPSLRSLGRAGDDDTATILRIACPHQHHSSPHKQISVNKWDTATPLHCAAQRFELAWPAQWSTVQDLQHPLTLPRSTPSTTPPFVLRDLRVVPLALQGQFRVCPHQHQHQLQPHQRQLTHHLYRTTWQPLTTVHGATAWAMLRSTALSQLKEQAVVGQHGVSKVIRRWTRCRHRGLLKQRPTLKNSVMATHYNC